MGAQYITAKQLGFRTPLIGDFFVFRILKISKPDNDPAPAFGTPLNQIDPVKTSWPNHKFAWREQIGEDKYRDAYVADLPTQNLYNWETISDESTWPTIRQVFVVPRNDYEANPSNPATLYPPPPTDTVDTVGYAITSLTETRSGDPKVDSLYVLVEVIREKIDEPISGFKFDPYTGAMLPYSIKKVPAGTPGQTISDDGTIVEITPGNTNWSIQNTHQASGLAGSAIDGVSPKSWDFVDDYFWPRVLSYIHIQAFLEDPSNTYSDVRGYSYAPVYLADQYNGPCKMTMVETWYKETPPEILPTVLYPRDISFRGQFLSVGIPHSLHGPITIFEPGFEQFYPQTNPVYWPATLIGSVTVQPDQGGWIQRVITVHAPSTDGQAPVILLTASNQDYDSFDLSWTGGAAGATTVNVATDPTFQTGFIPGYQGLIVPSGTSTITVTGALQGRYYYAQVTRGALKSNIIVVGVASAAVIEVTENGNPILSGGSITLPSAGVGQVTSQALIVRNVGSQELNNFSVSIVGANIDQFQTSGISVGALNPGETVNLTVQFNPTSGGTKTASLRIFSNSATGSPFIIGLTGISVAPVLRVDSPFGTLIPNGGSLAFGTYTDTPLAKTIYLRNTGDSQLTDVNAQISGSNAEDFSLTTIPSSVIDPSTSSSFVVTFTPTEEDSAPPTRSASLIVSSNDPVNPLYDVTISGVYQPPDAPGTVDPSLTLNVVGEVHAIAHQPDGKTLLGGLFTEVNGTPASNIVRVNPNGSLDGTFSCETDNTVRCIAIQPDGMILIGGEFSMVNGDPFLGAVRLTNAGVVDGTFTSFIVGSVYCMAIQSDGKFYIGGAFNEPGNYLVRYLDSGGYDSSFVTEITGPVYSISLMPNGQLVAGGSWPASDVPTTTTTPEPTTTTTVAPTTTTIEPTTTTTPAPTTTTPEPTTTTPEPTTTTPEPTTTTPEPTTTTSTTPEPTTTTSTPEPTTTTPEPDPVYGCTDPGATNYNPSATINDGSCTYPQGGCMDSNAINFDPSATYDDGSCVYPP